MRSRCVKMSNSIIAVGYIIISGHIGCGVIDRLN